MSNIFNIDFPKLVRLLIPPRLRKIKHVGWLQSLASPVNTLHQSFRRNRADNLYRLKITGQVVYMERLLNDRYDISARRIKIVDALSYDPVYLYLEEENKPVYLFTEAEGKPVYLYTEEETGMDAVDFWVLIPDSISYNETEIRAVIDSYKLAGKAYKIQKV